MIVMAVIAVVWMTLATLIIGLCQASRLGDQLQLCEPNTLEQACDGGRRHPALTTGLNTPDVAQIPLYR